MAARRGQPGRGLVHLLVDPAYRALGLVGARVLAGQLRDAVERRHAVAVARVGHSPACLFGLHALVPVPADLIVHRSKGPHLHFHASI